MRIALVILLWLSLSCQCFVQLGIIGWYQLNTQSITEKYCVNKDKPQLHCNGKCHLKKQLDKTENGDAKNKDNNKKIEWTVFILPENNYSHPQSLFIEKTETFNRQTDYSYKFLHSVFRPPQCI